MTRLRERADRGAVIQSRGWLGPANCLSAVRGVAWSLVQGPSVEKA
jgi:hypothetical protein